MQCLNCGKDYPDGASFCPDCGAANPGNVNQTNPNGGFQNQGFQNQGFQNQGFQNQAYQSQGNPNGGFKAPIKNRSIALCIILSFVTCGIYGIVWFINVADDLNMARAMMEIDLVEWYFFLHLLHVVFMDITGTTSVEKRFL